MNYTMPKDTKGLKSLIEAAIQSANTMKTKVQLAAVAILHHAYKHGDYTHANDLIQGLGHGVKRDSLVEWFAKFGGLTVDEEDASKGFTGWHGADYIKDNFNQAKETMWHELKKQSAFTGFILEDELRKVVKKYANMTKKMDNLDEADKAKVSFKVNDDLIKQVLAMVNFEGIIEEDSSESVEDQLKAHYEKTKAA